MKNLLWAIIKKEMLEALRERKRQILGAIIMPTVLEWLLLANSTRLSASAAGTDQHLDAMLKLAPTFSLMYVPLLLIPLLANILLIKSLVHEKITGAIIPTVATGINVGILWAAKTIAIFIYCFLISTVMLELDVLIMVFYFKAAVVCSLTTFMLIMLLAPVIALTITAIQSFIYWALKFNPFFAPFIPLATTMGVCYYGYLHPINPTAPVLLGGVIVTMLSAVVIFCACGYAVTKINRSQIISL